MMTEFKAKNWQLKKDEQTKDIPIIAVTVLKEKEDMAKMISCGISDHISKPFESEELIKKVKNNLSAFKE